MRLLGILLTPISSGASCTYTWSSTTYKLHVYETKSALGRACTPGPSIANTHAHDPPSGIHAHSRGSSPEGAEASSGAAERDADAHGMADHGRAG